jgi:hypothetical protein
MNYNFRQFNENIAFNTKHSTTLWNTKNQGI